MLAGLSLISFSATHYLGFVPLYLPRTYPHAELLLRHHTYELEWRQDDRYLRLVWEPDRR